MYYNIPAIQVHFMNLMVMHGCMPYVKNGGNKNLEGDSTGIPICRATHDVRSYYTLGRMTSCPAIFRPCIPSSWKKKTMKKKKARIHVTPTGAVSDTRILLR